VAFDCLEDFTSFDLLFAFLMLLFQRIRSTSYFMSDFVQRQVSLLTSSIPFSLQLMQEKEWKSMTDAGYFSTIIVHLPLLFTRLTPDFGL
jgi:hypothetical protein